ncbi:hypothetical protein [Rhodoglobus sp.]
MAFTPEGIAHTRLIAENLDSAGKTKEASHLRAQATAKEAEAERCNVLASSGAISLSATPASTVSRMEDVSSGGMQPAGDISTAGRAHVAATSTDASQLLSLARNDGSLTVLTALESNPAAGAEIQALIVERKALLQARGKDRAVATRARRARARGEIAEAAAPGAATKRIAHVQAPSLEESEFDTADRARYEERVSEQMKLATHKSVEVRMALAENRNANPAVLSTLARGSHKLIATYARNNKRYEG